MPYKIPVTITHAGKTYHGHLSPISGSGSDPGTAFSLNIGGIFRGELRLVEDTKSDGKPRTGEVKYKWKFFSQTREFENEATVQYFLDVLVAWYS